MIAGGVEVTRDLDEGGTKPPFSLGGGSSKENVWANGAVAGGDWEPGDVSTSSSSSLLDLLRCIFPLMGSPAESAMIAREYASQERECGPLKRPRCSQTNTRDWAMKGRT